MAHVFEGRIDVPVSFIPPSARASVGFFAGQIGSRTPEQLRDFAEPAAAVEIHVDGRVIVQVLPIDEGRAIDLADCRLHFPIGGAKVPHHVGFFADAQQKLRPPQVAASAKIRGMAAWFVGMHKRRDRDERKGEQSGT
jgi:hypothetical protein